MTVRVQLCRPYEILYLNAENTQHSCKPEWLDQYLSLREISFRSELNIPTFDGSIDNFDLSGYLLLLIVSDQCIGGARLNESSAGGDLLPLENDHFPLSDVFPELTEQRARYAQWTRLVVDERFRTPGLLNLLAASMAELSAERQHDYCFNVSGAERARLYRRLHLSQGFKSEIRREIEIETSGDFSHLEHLLSVAYRDRTMASLVYQPQDTCAEELIMAVA